jgi:8-oxo-dGTP pyrophosphatase MutT (NUDIX family)
MRDPLQKTAIPHTADGLCRIISEHIAGQDPPKWSEVDLSVISPSVVLFLIGEDPNGRPCMILNKRSQWVRQPGDLCFPGGGISPLLDRAIGRCLMLPGSPLRKGSLWKKWRLMPSRELEDLAFFLAAGLREGFEEMGINPFRLEFIGPLPPDHLQVYSRMIYPFAVRLRGQSKFRINWEVEKVIRVPLTSFFNIDNYINFVIPNSPAVPRVARERQTLCFRIGGHHSEPELLWGITLRIIVAFLEEMLGFIPPKLEKLPMINGRLSRPYLSSLPIKGGKIHRDTSA